MRTLILSGAICGLTGFLLVAGTNHTVTMAYEKRDGDISVFRNDKKNGRQPDYRGELLLNGQPLREPYLDPARCRFKRTRPPLTLGPEEYYVLGDNRDSSNDSRSVGPIRRRAIRGRVVCLVYRHVR